MATDKDESHAEYVSMFHLLNKNIGPYLGKLKTVYSLPGNGYTMDNGRVFKSHN